VLTSTKKALGDFFINSSGHPERTPWLSKIATFSGWMMGNGRVMANLLLTSNSQNGWNKLFRLCPISDHYILALSLYQRWGE
jgi:hypothetical protein